MDDSIDVCCQTQAGVPVDPYGRPMGDMDGDCDVDLEDVALMQRSLRGPAIRGCCEDVDCEDGDACTRDLCNLQAGCAYEDTACDDQDDCTDDSCDPATGCVNVLVCPICTPHQVRPCYGGPPGTQDIGTCKPGQQVCAEDGFAWGGCEGEVLPGLDLCGNGLDEDCDAMIDDAPDEDGDGWSHCEGDCCDNMRDGCGTSPHLVNPGALELIGNGIDDDCDPATSDTTHATCSATAKFNGVTATDLAQAMDICQTTTADPPSASRKWGLISALQLDPDGTAPDASAVSNIQNYQTAVLTNYGTGGVVPTHHVTMAGISTGKMRDQNDPGYAAPNTGSNFGRTLQIGAAQGPLGTYVAAHGGQLVPGTCGPNLCPVGTTANDGVLLRLTLRVPTNVQSLSFESRFFTAEYKDWQCTTFNDYFLSLLTTSTPGIPGDTNVSFDSSGRPINVNNSEFLRICPNNGLNCQACSLGTAALAGTGMNVDNTGAGTPWLTTRTPVLPGETITLEFLLFDVSDNLFDSLILLDNFRWGLTPVEVSTEVFAP